MPEHRCVDTDLYYWDCSCGKRFIDDPLEARANALAEHVLSERLRAISTLADEMDEASQGETAQYRRNFFAYIASRLRALLPEAASSLLLAHADAQNEEKPQ